MSTRPHAGRPALAWALTAALIAATALLSGCDTLRDWIDDALDDRPESWSGLGGMPLLDDASGACSVDAFSLPGQKMRLSGSTDGLAQSAPGPSLLPGAAGARWRDAFIGDPPHGRSAALLVVDDFSSASGTPVLRLDPALAESVGAGVSSAALAAWLRNGLLSHGALVAHHARAVLTGTEVVREDPGDDAETWRYRTPDTSAAELLVRAVDTAGLDSTIVAGALAGALARLASEDRVDRVVVNLSFVLLPCSTVEDFQANRDAYPTLEAYAAAVASANGVLAEEVLGAVTAWEVPSGDALRALVEDTRGTVGDRTVVFTAASGNFGLPYAMAPAAWDGVIGVGASSHPDDTPRADFANAAEVIDAGAWFDLVLEEVATAPVLAYAGTSFAAPSVAAYALLDLARADPRCGADGRDARLAHGRDLDWSLATAVALRCVP